mgnify:CR=1 FL=1
MRCRVAGRLSHTSPAMRRGSMCSCPGLSHGWKGRCWSRLNLSEHSPEGCDGVAWACCVIGRSVLVAVVEVG